MITSIGIILTLRTNRSIARKRATLDTLLLDQINPTVIEERIRFVTARSEGSLVKWADQQHANTPERRAIRAVLNQAEFVAIGIKEGTLDHALYKRSWRSTYVKDWADLKPFVMEIRRVTGVATLFCEYESLVRQWATKEERQKI